MRTARRPAPFAPSPEQRDVIEAPLQSLRVAAGAGTGKTTTLAHRVVSLIERHGVAPEEILGVTFTNKAAEELADRIRLTLGDRVEPGREVEVHTYHGFAAGLLREFGAFVGVERDADVVTPAYARQIIGSVLKDLPMEVFDPTARGAVESLRQLAAGLSDNLLAPAEVPTPDEGDQVWHRRREMLDALAAYDVEKRRLGVADYGDLVLLAHRLVTRHPPVAAAIRERYRAVVLDEYQDTNPGQRELLRHLFAGQVPVMAVGDEDQTIYEWRGASLDNFRGFPHHFGEEGAPTTTLPLTCNRRSGPVILEAANRIRSRIDAGEREPLTPLAGAAAGEVITAWFGTAADEAAWMARRMIRLHEEGRAWDSMAVLFRKNKDMLLVHDALARHDVPFEVANLGGLLTVPEVADLVAWLRVLHRPEEGPSLARLLLGGRYRLGLGDLAVLAGWVRRRRGAGDPDLGHDAALPDFTLLEAIESLDDLDGLRPGAREPLDQFEREYRDLLGAAQGLSLVELCRTILDRTGAWSDVDAMEAAAGLSARLNLYRFLDLAEDWSPLEGRPSLGAFIDHLDALADETAEELDTARISDSEAVTLITVHRAKGLEWPVVFLPAVYQTNFPNTFGRFDDPLRFAELVPYPLRLDAGRLPPIEEVDEDGRKELLRPLRDAQEWRIAYVAVTRAMELLHVTGAYWYGHPEPKKTQATPSPLFRLVEELEQSHQVHPTPEAPSRPSSLGVRADVIPAPDPLFEGGWPAALRLSVDDAAWTDRRAGELGLSEAYDAAVAGFQEMLFSLPDPPETGEPSPVETSATGLVTYASCPLRFYWSAVDRLPRRTRASARRGVDVHRRIELHHLGVVPLEEASPDTYDAVEDEESPVGSDPFGCFLRSRFARDRPVLVEAPFEVTLGPGVRVRGRIDAVYDHGDRWEVVDFKSGRPREDDARIVQLQTYAVAAQEVHFGIERPADLEVTFAYLGGEEPIEETHTVDRPWMVDARMRVDGLASGIAAEDWNPTPSDACRTCEFLGVCEAGRRHLGVR